MLTRFSCFGSLGTRRNKTDAAGFGGLPASNVYYMAGRVAGSNLRAARKLLRRLHVDERLDEVADALSTLLLTSAQLADDCTATDSDVPVYARTKALALHGVLLGQLRAMVPTVADEDVFGQFVAEMMKPSFPEDRPTPSW